MLRIVPSRLAALLLTPLAAPALAAVVTFNGITDSGSLAGEAFSGSFSYADPMAGYTGSVDLDSFTMSFFGQTYTLADADLAPVAWFDGGSFLGIDYLDADALPAVQLSAGFFSLDEALFAYQAAVNGFGSVSFTPAAVPLPGGAALVLAALAALALNRAPRRRR